MLYLINILTVVPRKILGLLIYWLVVPFRSYSRHVVHLYGLQNSCSMKRILERNPTRVKDGWLLQSQCHKDVQDGLIINDRKISKLEYWLIVILLWGWTDDDAYCDTFSDGHNRTYLNGERTFIGIHLTNKWLVSKCSYPGSTFDLGDKRAEHKCTNVLGQLIWNGRNSAYNFEYLLGQVALPEAKVWKKRILGWEFGYEYDSTVANKKWYTAIMRKVQQ